MNGPYGPLSKENERLYSLFHELWTKAVAAEGYEKEKWKELEAIIERLVQWDENRIRNVGW